MKSKLLTSVLVPVLLAGAALSGCATRTNYTDLYGMPAPLSAAQRTIVITPQTKHANIEGGQIVKFVVGDKSFVWNFYVARTVSSFDLNEVAPPGVLDHRVRVYLTPDPRYIGGDGRR